MHESEFTGEDVFWHSQTSPRTFEREITRITALVEIHIQQTQVTQHCLHQSRLKKKRYYIVLMCTELQDDSSNSANASKNGF